MSIIENKKARFDYHIEDTLEAGIVLHGHEVKSVREGKASIVGAYIKVYGGEAWLVGATIQPYQEKNTPLEYDAERSRKLLLTKDEIARLLGVSKEKGLTLVPLKLYNNRGKIKLSVGIAKSKKTHDKRETIKRRDIERETGRRLK